MYARYKRTRAGADSTHYKIVEEQIRLFGHNNRDDDGYIPWLLGLKIPPNQDERFLWHIDISAELDSDADYRSNTIIIDLKPKHIKGNISFYELLDVWGVSDFGWTPILLRLRSLFVDANPQDVVRQELHTP